MVLHPGQKIHGRYVIRKYLNEGASGIVYSVKDEESSQDLVLKIQHPRFLETSATYEGFSAALHDEVRTAAELNQVRGLLRPLDKGTHDGRAYYVMPDVQGCDLESYAETEGTVSSTRTAAIIAQLSRTLGEVHSHGWVHQDIKLDNALMGHDGRVWLIDLGLAVPSGAGGEPAGTPGYAAPEILEGEVSSARSDIFSLGCVLFRLAIRRFPFDNETGWSFPPAPPFTDDSDRALAALDPTLRALGLWMIEWNPDDRPQGPQEIEAELRRILPTGDVPPAPAREPDPVLAYWRLAYRGA
ncbi:serine/threonine-protein kinase [Amycolatopsis sp. NPDC089917]|uniref:serine/threonine-protein kinase n=1 Tax=Amycolatopsis sp. NPDC089917 TaxID=3155187 RepID=UPI00341DCA2E